MSELLEKELQHISKRLENLEHTIYGNGKQGLKADIIELKTQLETFRRIAVWQIGILISILGVLIKLVL